jgi:CelD/BcsL family acetyltransferase involved in cellulose biosynthesis
MKTQTDSSERLAALHVPIADVLRRVGRELAHLGRVLEQFENLTIPFILEAGRRDVDLLHQVQGVDHIGQTLSGLADFLAALAPAASDRWRVDPRAAAGTVTLAELAARLALSDEGGSTCPDERGDVELF